MGDEGKSAAASAGPFTGFNAADSQATTLETQAGEDVGVEGLDTLEVRPGLTFAGRTAARPV